MNRILFSLAIAILMLTTSCRKEYNCYCTTHKNGESVFTTLSVVKGKWYKSDAKCNEKGLTQAQQFSNEYSTSCVITKGTYVE